MNVHAMSSGTVNSLLTQLPNHKNTRVNQQGKTASLVMHARSQNGVNGQSSEEATESASEKAREAGQRKSPASGMKNKINLYV